jgi:hypothetical protein
VKSLSVKSGILRGEIVVVDTRVPQVFKGFRAQWERAFEIRDMTIKIGRINNSAELVLR